MTATMPVRATRPNLAAVPPAARDTYRRYRPGTFSATVETIRLTDGRSVRTDLIRLNPNVECYSLDLDGAAPRQPAHYTVTPWAEVRELDCTTHDVATILRSSYPAVGLAELSARVRNDGHPLSSGNLQAHEAIAATQAALWHITNGVDLDTRPVAAPVAMTVHQDGEPDAVPVSPEQPAWMGAVTRDRGVALQLTLADRLQLGRYSVLFAARPHLSDLRVHLERSPDGSAWTPVPSSKITAIDDTHVHKVLGVGATLADGHGQGYLHYRVVFTTESPIESRIGVEQVSLTPTGAPAYPNPDRVVHLYSYLVGRLGRQATTGEQVWVSLGGANLPTQQGDAVGPVRVQGVAPGQRFGLRALDPGTFVVDDDGDPVFRPVTSAEAVFLRLPRHRPTPMARLAVSLPLTDHLEPQLLLGASTPGATPQFTPVVRLFPTKREANATFLIDVTRTPDRLQRVD